MYMKPRGQNTDSVGSVSNKSARGSIHLFVCHSVLVPFLSFFSVSLEISYKPQVVTNFNL